MAKGRCQTLLVFHSILWSSRSYKNLVKEVMWHGGCFLRFALGFQLASKCSFFLNVKIVPFTFLFLYIFFFGK